ncbi:O-antigen ligase family protein [Macromonas nakdongensis]|uniref:O-antigen ligase family protein n=1 Tax=Macromonas nakdongensis TaxID=1843082 RepID=UPI000C34B74C|nr:O-antigen ligase family protein [Macromonas nakdongensis]
MQIKLTGIIAAVAIGLSPVYLWSSGLPQPSHLLFSVGLMLWMILNLKNLKSMSIPPISNYALAFLFYSIVVNTTVFVYHQDGSTILSSIYYAFNIISFIFIIKIASQYGLKIFLKIFYIVFWCVLVVVLMIALSCLGRSFGGYRVMSTFNDPNQFAHWLLWVALIISAIGWAIKKSCMPGVIAFSLAASGILASLSRSGMLALVVVMLVGLLVLLYSKSRSEIFLKANDFRVVKVIGVAFILSAPLLFVNFITPSLCSLFGNEHISQASRHTALYDRVSDRGLNSSFEGRGYDRLWKFPEYLFYGAGEGANHRWEAEAIFHGEVHSTFAGVWFYYGIPGLFFLLIFLYKIWMRLDTVWMKLLFFAPLAYSFGTYNLRNWMFWIGLAFLYLASEHARQFRHQD